MSAVAPLKRLLSETDISNKKQKTNNSNNNRRRKKKQKKKKEQGRCAQCGWVPGANPLSELQAMRGGRVLCRGCFVFFSRCRGEEEEAMFWVRTGEWRVNIPLPLFDEEEIRRRFDLKAIQINQRPSRSVPGWALSIDHIDPVNGQQEERLYGIDNLQIMISVFNWVKANHTTEQLQEWNNNCHPFLIVKIKFALIYVYIKLLIFNSSFIRTSLNILLFEYFAVLDDQIKCDSSFI